MLEQNIPSFIRSLQQASHSAASDGHNILLIKARGKRRNFYDLRDLTIICHQFYVALKYYCVVGSTMDTALQI